MKPKRPVAFVTGATEGIGRAIAFGLGRAGYAIGFCARREARILDLARDLDAAGIPAAGAPADVAREDQVGAAVRQAVERLGPVEVLVNNAGTGVLKPFEELTIEDWDRTMATNLRGLFLVTREVLPGMRSRKRGAIVNIASLAGRNGFAGGTAYAASKHAVLGFSKCLMLEVRKDGVRVIAVCPGSVDTTLRREATALGEVRSDHVLQPEDVADSVLAALRLPDRALVSELDIRPSNP